jgi:hypothetical protein
MRSRYFKTRITRHHDGPQNFIKLWTDAGILGRETNWKARKFQEAAEIYKSAKTQLVLLVWIHIQCGCE